MTNTRSLLPIFLVLFGCGDPPGAPGTDQPSTGTADPVDGAGGTGGQALGGGTGEGAQGGGGASQGGSSAEGGFGGGAPDLPETVIVQGPNGLAAYVPVIVNDSNGILLDATQTNAGGAVDVNVPPGGSVTVLDEVVDSYNGDPSTRRTVQTSFDVPQGSTVQFRLDGPFVHADPDPMTLTVNLTSYPIGAASASVWACGSRQDFAMQYPATMVVQFPQFRCYESSYHLAVVLWDASGAPFLFASGGPVGFNPGSTLSWTFDSYDPPTQTVLWWSEIPADATDPLAWVHATSYGRKVLSTSAPLTPGAGGPVVLPIAPGEDNRLWLSYSLPARRNVSRVWGPFPNATTYSFGGAGLQLIDELGPPDLSDIERPRFAWQSSGAGAPGDLVYLTWGFGTSGEWTYFRARVAPSTEHAEFPELPSDLGDFVPQPGDWFDGYSVGRVDLDEMDGYDAGINAPLGEGSRTEVFAWYQAVQ